MRIVEVLTRNVALPLLIVVASSGCNRTASSGNSSSSEPDRIVADDGSRTGVMQSNAEPNASGEAGLGMSPDPTPLRDAQAQGSRPNDAASPAERDPGRIATNTVLLISLDGLAPRFVEQLLAQGKLPNFARLQQTGAFTHNARTEARSTVTMPNHTSMMTGRPAVDVPGLPVDTAHGFTLNYDPGGDATLHNSGNPNLAYVTSIFCEIHDRGGYTALFSGKSKFELFRRSYSAPHARPDLLGADDGLDKIDDFMILVETADLLTEFLSAFTAGVRGKADGPNFAMFHYRDTDSQGHGYGWGSDEYLAAVEQADRMLGQILSHIEATPELAGTVLIVTADHGGVGTGHFDPADPDIVRIPFYVQGRTIPQGTDLYALAGSTRTDPGSDVPLDGSGVQPIRDGDAANLAMRLLGLGIVPGSLHLGMSLDGVVPLVPVAEDPAVLTDASVEPKPPVDSGSADVGMMDGSIGAVSDASSRTDAMPPNADASSGHADAASPPVAPSSTLPAE